MTTWTSVGEANLVSTGFAMYVLCSFVSLSPKNLNCNIQ